MMKMKFCEYGPSFLSDIAKLALDCTAFPGYKMVCFINASFSEYGSIRLPLSVFLNIVVDIKYYKYFIETK
jgi:hypothetical protein